MRQVEDPQLTLGSIGIEEIRLDPKSRDDIPAILLGLQHLYADVDLRARLFALLEEQLCPGVDLTVGRPGLEFWKIVVMGVVKQGLGCDFDRLHELVNQHLTLRKFLGHATGWDEASYEYQTVVDNVCLLRPELLAAIGQLVVESGHRIAKKKPGEPLRGRCDSFVVETDVHYPTDVSLLWDAMRCLLRTTGRAATRHGLRGWRQWRHLSRDVRTRFHRVRTTRRAQAQPERVTAYLERCRALMARAEATLGELAATGDAPVACVQIEAYLGHARRQIDQVERRLLRGEAIPHEEKVFSIFEEHTSWNQRFPFAGPGGWRTARGGAGFQLGRFIQRNGVADGDAVLANLHFAHQQAEEALAVGDCHGLLPFAHAFQELPDAQGDGQVGCALELG